jgi:hypothetical protein
MPRLLLQRDTLQGSVCALFDGNHPLASTMCSEATSQKQQRIRSAISSSMAMTYDTSGATAHKTASVARTGYLARKLSNFTPRTR